MQGYIKDHRKELLSDIWAMPPLYHRVWQWLKYHVNHNDNEIPLNDGTRLHIKKGQHLTSIRKIARGVGYYDKGLWEEPNPRTIDRILKWLVRNNMIIVENGKDGRQYTLITIMNWEAYQMEEAIPKKKETEKPMGKPAKKPKEEKYPEGSPYHNMAIYFYGQVSRVAEEAGVSHLLAKSNMQKWADEFRKLIENDKVDKLLAKEVMDWVVKDPFWSKNVLSAKKFKDQFAKLAIAMNKNKTPFDTPIKQVDSRDKEIEFSKWIANGGDPDAFDWSS